MRLPGLIAGVPLIAALVLVLLATTGSPPFDDGAAAAGAVPRAKVNRFDGGAAFRSARFQVELGPRPAGSPASRAVAERMRRVFPAGRFQAVPGGLRNVVGRVEGRDRGRFVVVGAHYDTKDLPGFVGANDGASGTAIVTQLARRLRPRSIDPTVVFVLFDGEESPAGAPDAEFEARGLRGSKVAAARYSDAEAMILLDFVGERGLRIPREALSDARLWTRLRRAAGAVGVGRVFPARQTGAILDDHVPFIRAGVPSIDLIDFDYDCFHQTCDDLSQISPRSLDAVGESVRRLLDTL